MSAVVEASYANIGSQSARYITDVWGQTKLVTQRDIHSEHDTGTWCSDSCHDAGQQLEAVQRDSHGE